MKDYTVDDLYVMARDDLSQLDRIEEKLNVILLYYKHLGLEYHKRVRQRFIEKHYDDSVNNSCNPLDTFG